MSDWLERLGRDGEILDEVRKTELAKYLLIHTVPLAYEDADYFLQSGKLSEPDDLLRYATVEKKVADSFSGATVPVGLVEFRSRFAQIMEGFYTSDELAELCSLFVTESDASIAVGRLVGYEHPHWRKIRNAYLPAITDVIVVDQRGVHDVTGDLFDGPQDAVAQIDALLGKDN